VNDKMMKCLNDKINILDFWQARIRIRAYIFFIIGYHNEQHPGGRIILK